MYTKLFALQLKYGVQYMEIIIYLIDKFGTVKAEMNNEENVGFLLGSLPKEHFPFISCV